MPDTDVQPSAATNGHRYPCSAVGCTAAFPTPQALGSHKRYSHTGAIQTKAKKPKRPVHVELVDEDPPPPVVKAPKISDLDRILNTVESAEMQPGKWMRVAVFISSRAARSMGTRLQKRTEGGAWEWYAPGDDRLFVRARPDDA